MDEMLGSAMRLLLWLAWILFLARACMIRPVLVTGNATSELRMRKALQQLPEWRNSLVVCLRPCQYLPDSCLEVWSRSTFWKTGVQLVGKHGWSKTVRLDSSASLISLSQDVHDCTHRFALQLHY